MKTSLFQAILAFCLLQLAASFTTPGKQGALQQARTSTTKLNFFGEPKDDGKPGDYVCKVSLSKGSPDQCLEIARRQTSLMRSTFLPRTRPQTDYRLFSDYRIAVMSSQRGQKLGQLCLTTTHARPAVRQSVGSRRFPREVHPGRSR